MLLVDYREGSKELIVPLQKMGLPVEEADIDADIAFVGRGEGGKPVDVGVEFKQLRECVDAMRSERLQGVQVPRMVKAYDFRYLMVEGELLYDRTGRLLRRTGRKTFKPLPGGMGIGEFLKRVYVLHMCSGMTFLHTRTRTETLKYVEVLYRAWTDVDMDQHKSHLGSYSAPTPIPVSDFRQAVMKWPGIGFKVSRAVEEAFGGSIAVAATAPVTRWAAIQTEGRRLGEKTAQRIVTFLEGK